MEVSPDCFFVPSCPDHGWHFTGTVVGSRLAGVGLLQHTAILKQFLPPSLRVWWQKAGSPSANWKLYETLLHGAKHAAFWRDLSCLHSGLPFVFS